jgi:hypothetical protein
VTARELRHHDRRRDAVARCIVEMAVPLAEVVRCIAEMAARRAPWWSAQPARMIIAIRPDRQSPG